MTAQKVRNMARTLGDETSVLVGLELLANGKSLMLSSTCRKIETEGHGLDIKYPLTHGTILNSTILPPPVHAFQGNVTWRYPYQQPTDFVSQ